MHMKKRMIAMLLALVLVLGLLPTGMAYEQNLETKLPGRIELVTKGDEMLTQMRYLEFKDQDTDEDGRPDDYTGYGMDYVYTVINGKEYPAYCKEPENQSITVGGTRAGHKETFIADERETDAWILGALQAGFNVKTPKQLGFKTDNEQRDIQGAYYATKAAIWAYLKGMNPETDIRVYRSLDDNDFGEKVLTATRTIYSAAKEYANAVSSAGGTNPDLNPKISCVPDYSVAYPVSANSKNYLQQVFTVTCNAKPNGPLTLTCRDNTVGALITQDGSRGIPSLTLSGSKAPYTGTFKVLVPEGAPQNGKLSIQITGKATRVEAFVAHIASNQEGIQKFVIPAAPETDIDLTITPTWMRSRNGSITIRKTDTSGAKFLAGAEFELTFPDGTAQRGYFTDSKGEVTITGLEPGRYTVKEVEAPSGYVICSPDTREVAVALDKTSTVTFKDAKGGAIQIHKTTEDGRDLDGVSFEITCPSGSAVDETTASGGYIRLYNLEPGTYFVREKEALPGYVLPETLWRVEVQEGKTAKLEVVNHGKPGIKIIKEDETGKPLDGVTFQITKDGNPVPIATETTAGGGVILLEGLEPGRYTITETESTDETHVMNATPQTVVLTEDSGIVTVRILNYTKPGLHIYKRDSENNPLTGAAFSIQAKGSKLPAVQYEVDAGGKVDLSNCDPDIYIIREVRAPEGYEIDPTVREVELVAGKSTDVVFTDKKSPNLTVLKTDGSDHPLVGAVFAGVKIQAAGETGEPETLPPMKTDGSGKATWKSVSTGAYLIWEETPPAGFAKDTNTYSIELAAGQDGTITVVDKALPTLTVEKRDAETGEPIPGVQFALSPISGERSIPFTTEAPDGKASITVEPGVYLLRELSGPEDYICSSEDQVVELKAGDAKTITITNHRRPQLALQKVSRETGEGLEGATFRIETIDGTLVDTCTTGLGGTAIVSRAKLSAGWYRITETNPPAGYTVDRESQVVLLEAGKDSTVTFQDTPLPGLTIQKIDAKSKDGLQGASIMIYGSPDGTGAFEALSDDPYQTDKDGFIYLPSLAPGWYRLEEIAAPEGYHLSDPTTQLVHLDPGGSVTAIFEDVPKSALVLRKEDADTGAPLPGAVFEVRKAIVGTEGPVIGIYETGVYGAVTVAGLDVGTYIVREIAAPENYAIDQTPQWAAITGGVDELYELTFRDTALGAMRLIKEDGDTHRPLAGARYRISCDQWRDGDAVYETRADGVITLTGLNPGQTLRVQEIQAPDGYVLDPTVWEVPITAGKTFTLPLVNQPLGTLILQKTDDKQNKPLQGAQFRITDASGNPAGPDPNGLYTTDGQGRITLEDIKPGVYTITETRAPAGYARKAYSETVTVSPGKPVVVPFTNTALGGLLIQKADAETGEGLEGVSFKILDSSGKPAGNAPDGVYQTGPGGRIWLQGIPSGTYRVQEQVPLSGYQLDDTVYTATVRDGETAMLTIENEPLGGILIHKQDADTGEALQGVQFRITDGNGTPLGERQGLFETDASGDIYLTDIPAGQTVRIQETKALPGYVLKDRVYTATAKPGELVTVQIQNARKGGLVIQKTDAITGKPLAGAVFLITTPDGTFVNAASRQAAGNGRYSTGTDGTITLSGLEPQTLIVTELKAPAGYLRQTARQTVQLTEDKTVTITFPNMPQGGLAILKTDSKTNEPIPGVQFRITDAKGVPVGDAQGIFTTDEHGAIRLPELEEGTYLVTEVQAAPGYIQDLASHTVTVSDGDTAVLRLTNTPAGRLEIRKIEAGSKKPLAGAKLLVTAPDGTQTTLTTDGAGIASLDNLVPGTYKVQELAAPKNYIRTDSVFTTSVQAGETTVLTVPNTPMGRLEIRKIDAASKEPLAGASFQVTAPDGKTYNLRTDDNGIAALDGLTPGQFTIQEKDAPDGYLLSDTVYTVSLAAGKPVVQVIPNAKVPAAVGEGVLLLTKLDADTKTPLAGAQFQLTAPDGTQTILTTDTSGIAVADLLPGTYQLKEQRAPEGYVLDKTVRTVVIAENKAAALEVRNTKEKTDQPEENKPTQGAVVIRKTDDTQPALPVSGVTFEIRKADGMLVFTLQTDSQGVATAELPAGSYFAVETACPDNYILDSTKHTFTVEPNKTITMNITNRQYGSIRIHKRDSKTGAGIPNVSFLVQDSNGQTIGTYTTDKDGYVEIGKLDAKDGPFFVQETLAAPGYVPDNTRKSLSVTPGEVLDVDWLNAPIAAGTGRIQITKTAATAVPEQGIAAGDPLSGAVYTVSDAATGAVLGTVETGADGTAQTKDLPIGRYFLTESKAPEGFRLNTSPMAAEITASGQVVQLTQTDWPLSLGVSIRKTGNQEIQPGQMLTYTISDIANLSDADLSQFYWRDTLPAGLELLQITTGTYNTSLLYRVEYKTNRQDYQVLADGLDSEENHAFAMSATDLGLASGEYVTEVRLAFGTVPAGFASVQDPILQVQVPSTLSGGTNIRNTADAGGRYGDAWLTESASWETAVRVLDEELPKTGF